MWLPTPQGALVRARSQPRQNLAIVGTPREHLTLDGISLLEPQIRRPFRVRFYQVGFSFVAKYSIAVWSLVG